MPLTAMKAVRCKVKPRAAHPGAKAQHRAHAVYMYKSCKEIEPVRCRLVHESKRFLLRRVGLEAARLSAFNRRGIITSSEISAALQQLLSPRRMDGA